MPTQLTRNQIISLLRAEKSYLTKEFGVVNIGLFGSFATGRSDMNSDIDLIVELTEPRFDYLAGLQVYLEKKFSRKIEIVRKGNMINTRFFQKVEKDAIYA
ncbi:MAG: nucleotidyltransferase domain-containing protein [Deltaproteobacteria bacterium]|nr:nucleotidyltransferase domain-containing protein [Deltaproteobacteria bacterium]